MDTPGELYQVTITKRLKGWRAEVEGRPFAWSPVPLLAVKDETVRYGLGMDLDLPVERHADLKLAWTYRSGDEAVDREGNEIRKLRESVRQAQAHLQRRTAALAGKLSRKKWPVKDTAVWVDLTPQRVSQLVALEQVKQ